ncbi:MAG: hypothetical protein RMJ44_03230 [Cytophagales bacterium]|nr:hypothetical protein [Bernardetiaceae bacterium]MDW8210076.1 hypothetical protein [Cytophagales bacterium]
MRANGNLPLAHNVPKGGSLLCAELMNFVKRLFMQRRLNKLLKVSRKRSMPSFTASRHIGVLFNGNNHTIKEPLASIVQGLQKEGKDVSLLAYFEDNIPHFHFPFEAFTSRQMDWLGNIRSEKVHQFIEKKFDFLFCFNEQPCQVTDLILAQSNAHCRVGLYQKGKEPFYELMFIPDQQASYEQVIHQVIEYTKMICQN